MVISGIELDMLNQKAVRKLWEVSLLCSLHLSTLAWCLLPLCCLFNLMMPTWAQVLPTKWMPGHCADKAPVLPIMFWAWISWGYPFLPTPEVFCLRWSWEPDTGHGEIWSKKHQAIHFPNTYLPDVWVFFIHTIWQWRRLRFPGLTHSLARWPPQKPSSTLRKAEANLRPRDCQAHHPLGGYI